MYIVKLGIRVGIGYDMVWVRVGSRYEVVRIRVGIRYELAWYDLVRVRVDWKPLGRGHINNWCYDDV